MAMGQNQTRQGKVGFSPQVLVLVSIYQGSMFGTYF